MNYVRIALSTIDKEKRREIAESNDVLDEVLKLWNGARICGQCKHFTQLGGRGSGLNGMCHALNKREYVKPEENACKVFDVVSEK